MSDKIPKPRIIAFEVTTRCLLNCRHCRASSTKDQPDSLTTDQCKKILKSIADEDDRTIAWVVRKLLVEAMEARGFINKEDKKV